MRARGVRVFLAATVASAGLWAWGAVPAGAGGRVLTVMKLVRALNKGDADAYLSYFSSTPTVTEEFQRPIRGRAAVRRDVAEEISDGVHVVLSQHKESGDSVSSRFRVTFDEIEQLGVRRVTGWVTFRFEGDKVDQLDIRFDRNDPQTAKFLKAVAAIA